LQFNFSDVKSAGACNAYFTFEINHGVLFLGNGSNMTYVDGHIIGYDQVDIMNLHWST
jgi:prepilin-type processing-associated H-X9-DG protein